jgi:hypothetical protein
MNLITRKKTMTPGLKMTTTEVKMIMMTMRAPDLKMMMTVMMTSDDDSDDENGDEGDSSETGTEQESEQKNVCSGWAVCINVATNAEDSTIGGGLPEQTVSETPMLLSLPL